MSDSASAAGNADGSESILSRWRKDPVKEFNQLATWQKVSVVVGIGVTFAGVVFVGHRFFPGLPSLPSSKVSQPLVPLVPARPPGLGPGLTDVTSSGMVMAPSVPVSVEKAPPSAPLSGPVQVIVNSQERLQASRDFVITSLAELQGAPSSTQAILKEILADFKSGTRSNKVYSFVGAEFNQHIRFRVLTCEGQAKLSVPQVRGVWQMNHIALIFDDPFLTSSKALVQAIEAMARHYGCTHLLVITQMGLIDQIGNQVRFCSG